MKPIAAIDYSALSASTGFYYLATPYSRYHAGIEGAWKDACVAAAHLISRGVRVYSPIAHTHPIAIHGGIDPHDHEIWIPADQPMMDAATGLIVAQMDGWKESKGVNIEISVFGRVGKPIIFLPWPLEAAR